MHRIFAFTKWKWRIRTVNLDLNLNESHWLHILGLQRHVLWRHGMTVEINLADLLLHQCKISKALKMDKCYDHDNFFEMILKVNRWIANIDIDKREQRTTLNHKFWSKMGHRYKFSCTENQLNFIQNSFRFKRYICLRKIKVYHKRNKCNLKCTFNVVTLFVFMNECSSFKH